MKPLTEIKRKLVCPIHRCTLQFDPIISCPEGIPWTDGQVHCSQGCVFQIERGIPRLVPRDNYASAFGLQWERYQKTQLDSYTGQPYSRERLERCLGMPLEKLTGKVVLECGAGAGRFTELLIDHCEALVALDLSTAVDANLKNCAGKKPYLLLQADMNSSPLPYRFFDAVICLGVIQHTPSPELTIASLAQHVKPGGLLVIDHATFKSPLSTIGRFLTLVYPLRAILKRLRPDIGLKVTMALTKICDPVRKHTCKALWLDRIASRLFPSACYYSDFPLLDPEIAYEWNELDTHNNLTAFYVHLRSPEAIRRCLLDLDFQDITCNIAGYTVEARASSPQWKVSAEHVATVLSENK
jgi:SAM-dependent methyltransferase